MQERLQHEEEVTYNNGVWWSESLLAVPISDQAAAERGIKRGADKVGCLADYDREWTYR